MGYKFDQDPSSDFFHEASTTAQSCQQTDGQTYSYENNSSLVVAI